MSMIGMVVRNLETIKNELELAIAATPTSPRRNELCDANIHLGEALNLLVNGASRKAPRKARLRITEG